MDVIQSLNDDAVAYFCEKRQGQAMALFIQAAHLLRDLVGVEYDEDDDDILPVKWSNAHLLPVRVPGGGEYNEPGICESLSFYHSMIVFRVPSTSMTDHHELTRQYALAGGVIFYNIGVCFHYSHFERKEQSLLVEAVKRYNVAATFLQKVHPICTGIELLSMALANNLSQLYSMSFDEVSMDMTLHGLERSVFSMRSSLRACCKDFDFFYVSLFLVRESRTHSCTASAA